MCILITDTLVAQLQQLIGYLHIQHMEKINSLIFRYCTCMNIEELNLHQNAGLARVFLQVD